MSGIRTGFSLAQRGFDLGVLVQLDLKVLELRIFVRGSDGSHQVAGLARRSPTSG